MLLVLIAAHERAWQANHAAIRTAAELADKATADLARAELTWRNCRHKAGHPDTPGDDCHCGRCAARYLTARRNRDDARAAITAAQDIFKAGVTVDQHAAQYEAV